MTIRMPTDVKDKEGKVLLKGKKEYFIKEEEEHENPNKIIVVVESEIKGKEVLIITDKECD